MGRRITNKNKNKFHTKPHWLKWDKEKNLMKTLHKIVVYEKILVKLNFIKDISIFSAKALAVEKIYQRLSGLTFF
jgi:hypothetical protein